MQHGPKSWRPTANVDFLDAEQSVVAVMARAAGLTVPALLARGVAQALARRTAQGTGWTA